MKQAANQPTTAALSDIETYSTQENLVAGWLAYQPKL